MRKSPLSAPDGNYGRKNNYRNFRDRRQGYEGGDGGGGYSGYDQQNKGNVNDESGTGPHLATGNNQSSPQNIGNDFIPLGFSSPVNHRPRFNSGHYRGRGGYNSPQGYRNTPPGGPGNGGFGNPYRKQFHHNNQHPNFNDSHSPKFFHKQQFGGRRGSHSKDAHRNVDISQYLNIKSVLEDPWAELLERYEKSVDTSSEDKSEACVSGTSEKSSCASILIGDLTVKSDVSNLESASLESQTNVDEKSEELITTTTVAS